MVRRPSTVYRFAPRGLSALKETVMTKRTLLSTVTVLGSAMIALLSPACGGDDTAVPTDAGTDGSTTQDGATNDGATGGDGGTNDGAANDAGVPAPTFVTHFTAANGELPEGLTYRGGKAYVGLAPTERSSASILRPAPSRRTRRSRPTLRT